MSVAAMTMDDQRPLMNPYDKMPKQYEQNLHHGGGGGGAPPSGPASPTPSGSEEPTSSHATFHHSHHSSSHHHSSHSHSHHAHHHAHFHSSSSSHHHQESSQPLRQQSPPPLLSASASAATSDKQQPSAAEAVALAAAAAAAQRQRLLEDEIESLKLEQTRLSQQSSDALRREKILMRRLANKEQEFQDYVSQIAEYKAAQAPSALALRSALLDPAVNLLFEKLKKELKATKAKLEETQNELSAWKFTPDSNTGKRLMAKCRLLYQENEELGKMTSNGRLAKLETELAMQKSFSEEVKKSQSELDDFLQELDEDVEGMQSTILFLQQELKTTRDRIQLLEKENFQLKNGCNEVTIAKNNSNSEDVQMALASSAAVPLNGIAAAVAAATPILTNANTVIVNEKKFPPLETIVEESRTATTASSDLFNGTNAEQNTTDCSIGGNCSSNNINNNNSVRTAAARKRQYEDDVGHELMPNAVAVVTTPLLDVPQMVSSPRTLPPKKAKMRHMPPRRASTQMFDINNEISAQEQVGIAATPTDPLGIVDNAVAGMANEETPASSVMPVDEAAVVESSVSAVPQRIMTRRRSVRMQQQNGGGGGDSNH